MKNSRKTALAQHQRLLQRENRASCQHQGRRISKLYNAFRVADRQRALFRGFCPPGVRSKLPRFVPGWHVRKQDAILDEVVASFIIGHPHEWRSTINRRGHFFAAAAEAMRRILIDNARRKASPMHGGDRQRVEYSDIRDATSVPAEDLLALDEALTKLARINPSKAELVRLRFYAGMTVPEAATALGVSVATAERQWTYARSWLYCHLLRDGLDWIVMKALEKERTRRYQTASDLAKDLQRYLHDEPIDARPSTLADRAGKWARRHRPIVWSAAALLVLSAIGSLVSALRIAREHGQTVRAYGEKAAQLEATERAEQLAVAQKQEAIRQREEAVRQRDLAERNLYLAHMPLVMQGWQSGQIDPLLVRLHSHVPGPGLPDFREWEWHYLLSLCHTELLTLRGKGAAMRRRVVQRFQR